MPLKLGRRHVLLVAGAALAAALLVVVLTTGITRDIRALWEHPVDDEPLLYADTSKLEYSIHLAWWGATDPERLDDNGTSVVVDGTTGAPIAGAVLSLGGVIAGGDAGLSVIDLAKATSAKDGRIELPSAPPEWRNWLVVSIAAPGYESFYRDLRNAGANVGFSLARRSGWRFRLFPQVDLHCAMSPRDTGWSPTGAVALPWSDALLSARPIDLRGLLRRYPAPVPTWMAGGWIGTVSRDGAMTIPGVPCGIDLAVLVATEDGRRILNRKPVRVSPSDRTAVHRLTALD